MTRRCWTWRNARLAALLLTASAGARAAPGGDPTARVLFVGNSYTYFNDLPEMLAALAAAGGHALETRMVAPGGWRLRDHFEGGEALGVLRAEHWDFVVL